MRPQGTAEELEERRRRAVALLKSGKSQHAVARYLGVSQGSVQRWVVMHRSRGSRGLRAVPHPGRTPKLPADKLRRVPELLKQGATTYGYSTDLWTLPRIAEVLQKKLGVSYQPGYVWYLLRKLGWSCQKPKRYATERNEAAVKRWVREDWPRIKKSPSGR